MNRILGQILGCVHASLNHHIVFNKTSRGSQIFMLMSETFYSNILELLEFYSQSLTMANMTTKTNHLCFEQMTFYWPWMCLCGTGRLNIESGQLHIHKQQCVIWRCHTCKGASNTLLIWHNIRIIRKSASMLFSTTANWIFHIESVWLDRNLETNYLFSETDSEI